MLSIIHEAGIEVSKVFLCFSYKVSLIEVFVQILQSCVPQVFDDCLYGGGSVRLMCWPHVYRNNVPRLKHLKSVDKNLAIKVLSDIEDLQWSAL